MGRVLECPEYEIRGCTKLAFQGPFQRPPDHTPTESGSRLWRPLYSFSYGAGEKQTVGADTIIIRTTDSHEADLIEEGKGPVSKRIVGTYTVPVEITLKRVPAP